MKKILLALASLTAITSLTGCVISPGGYDNVELVQCANRGKVFLRHDVFGLCGEELASRMNKGTITSNDMIAGGMGTEASVARQSASIQAEGTMVAGAAVGTGLMNQNIGIHRG